MKILFIVSYITILENKNYTKNITGYGLITRDIAEFVSKRGVDFDVIGSSLITTGGKYHSFNILRRTWADIFLHMKPYYFRKGLQFIKTYQPSFNRGIKALYFFLSAGYVEHVLKHGNYDLVHIQGIGLATKPIIECCERLQMRYLVSLQGLNSFSDSVPLSNGEKRLEKDFLRAAYKDHIPLTTCSTGVMNVIKDYLKVQGNIEHFHVVTNGTNVTQIPGRTLDLHHKYGVNPEKKIMLCVANICKRKNQAQIVRAYALLPEEVKRRLSILFLGTDTTGGELKRQIDEFGLANDLILCGNISRDEMDSYYTQSDYTILASISEGFGLSIIEGFVYGLPNLSFADLDAVVDLFEEKTMLILSGRSDADLAGGMAQMLSKYWDREYIQQYAKKFSLERMAHEYVKCYQEVIG